MNVQQSQIPDPGSNPAKAGAALDQTNGIIQNALSQLKALPEPVGDEATLQAIWTDVANALSIAQQEAVALKANNTTKATQLDTQLTTAQNKANADSNAYGLTVCGS